MTLPHFLSKVFPKKEEKSELFLALEISDDFIKAAVFEVLEGTAHILQKSTILPWEKEEELLETVDRAVSGVLDFLKVTSVEKLPVVFGVPESFALEGKIVPEKIALLKKICQGLNLKPTGFVITLEVLPYFLQRLEGSIPTAILIGVSRKEIKVTLLHVGKNEGTKIIKKTEEGLLSEAISALLCQFNLEILPSKILLYDGSLSLENFRQELLSYPWQTKNNFLHFPKIEIMEDDFSVKAVCLAAALEMGKTLEIEIAKEEKETKPEVTLAAPEEKKAEEPSGKFPGQNILEFSKVFFLPLLSSLSFASFLKDSFFKFKFPPVFSAVKDKLVVLNFWRNFKLAGFLLLLLLFLLGGVAVFAYWYIPKAEIKIFLDQKTLIKEMEMTVNPNLAAADFEKKQIPGEAIEVSEQITKKDKTSGKKIVGEKAKGVVTVYNKNPLSGRTFKAGTVILGPKNLKFTLDEDLLVASASDTGTSLEYGKAQAKITASQIGEESNLETDNSFSLADLPTTSFSAKNEKTFLGGTSREVAVVAKSDQEKLLNSAISELLEKAKADIREKVKEEKKFVEKSLNQTVVKKVFDKEVEQEADEVSLSLEIKFKATVYRESDLLALADKVLSESTPEGFSLTEGLETDFNIIQTKKDGSLSLKGVIKAKLLPKIEINEVKKNITGKYPNEAETYFKKLNGVVGFEMNLWPRFPRILWTLPRNPGNIKIEASPKRSL